MKHAATIQRHLTFPPVSDIFDVVPLPFTQQVAAPDTSSKIPNALRLVCRMGGTPPAFSDYPHSLTIPGNTFDDSETFVRAMQATIRWIHTKTKKNLPGTIAANQSQPSGQRTEHWFKREFRCPSSGQHIQPPNSRKKAPSQKIDCPARFSISHHIKTNSLRVVWWWDHNHDPYSHEDMALKRRPYVVDQWLNDRVVAGLGWNAIEQLLRFPELSQVSSNVFCIKVYKLYIS
ncbi:hypothetical protein PGTUg99_016204 [Puccinia graminis f. sp. tritici]|uniref:Uncharacterized protein n=1 Tax=Puccinia graminis f. sp. tritici TaxID=56615 RepID=A0A5B0SBZ3_PUCGR|nr:hypothetical protein PGTUg99_016204 [Puccinia graminis f. sp. tritici]